MPPLISFLFLLTYLTSAIANTTFILTFKSYLPHATHVSNLLAILALTPQSHYHIIPRTPPFPTDFLLLETPNIASLSFLHDHPSVHSVQPQSTFRKISALPPRNVSHAHTRQLNSASAIFDPLPRTLPHVNPFNAATLWRAGYTGRGIKVAIFDTGVRADFPVASAHDYTGENTTVDSIGHGTFVASLIGSSHPSCPGLAPHAQLHIFRVFTGTHISYTSWFLDAFNHALQLDVHILNLSIGGPDFADIPFVEKVNEITAHGIIITSAIGNDGPLWGTLNNPADMLDVIGVGGAEPDASVASFSSRGMTTHELPSGYGRAKPDIIAYARNLIGESQSGECKKLSGTSVAAPVVAGVAALLASAVKQRFRRQVINPAAVKRALMKTARLGQAGLYEQGAGLINVEAAVVEMKAIESEFVAASMVDEDHDTLKGAVVDGTKGWRKGPSAFFFPSYYDLTPDGCPYMWPHCSQPLYQGAIETLFNVSIFNPAGVEGRVVNVSWASGAGGSLISISVSPPSRFWPWAAGLGVHIKAVSIPTTPTVAEGVLKLRVDSVHEHTYSDIELPVRALVVAPPVRERRLLWDIYHSIRYPPGYVPRDSLSETNDILDWLADHPHTNFRELYRRFLNEGFYIDILDRPLTCFSETELSRYSGLLIIDSEDEFSEHEIAQMEMAVKKTGLSLFVVAEWYNLDIMSTIKFEDDNTRSWWSPIMAGGNVPALNRLLMRFGIQLGDAVISGDVHAGDEVLRVESGVPIVMFPADGEVLHGHNMRQHVMQKMNGRKSLSRKKVSRVVVGGVTKIGNGAVLVLGDSNCIDTAYEGRRCYDYFVQAVRNTILKCGRGGRCAELILGGSFIKERLQVTSSSIWRIAKPMPKKWVDIFQPHSRVLSRERLSDLKVCREIESVKRRIEASEIVSVVRLKKGLRAQGLKSETEYYSETYGWRRRDAFTIKDGANERLSTANGDGWRSRSVLMVCMGIILIIGSFWIRKKKRFVLRKRVKKRYGRSSAAVKRGFESPFSSFIAASLSGLGKE